MAIPMSQSRKPTIGTSATADKSKGTRSKTPPLPSNMGDHIPVIAEGVMAAPKGKPLDGMGSWPSASMREQGRMPDIAPSVYNKKGRGC